MIVYLSCYQKDVLFSKDNNIKFDFYPTDNGYEVALIDENQKYNIMCRIADNVFKILDKEKSDEQESSNKKVTVLKFKNGDRDVLSAIAGTIRYKFYEVEDVDNYKDQDYYEKLKEGENPILFLSYIPDTDKLLHVGITFKKKE